MKSKVFIIGLVLILLLSFTLGTWRHFIAFSAMWLAAYYLNHIIQTSKPIETIQEVLPLPPDPFKVNLEWYAGFLVTDIEVTHKETGIKKVRNLHNSQWTRNPADHIHQMKKEIINQIKNKDKQPKRIQLQNDFELVIYNKTINNNEKNFIKKGKARVYEKSNK